jgi:hypothetical protein
MVAMENQGLDEGRHDGRVFDLLRLGLTNEEISDRLGLTLDDANYRVSEILSELGVSSRREAAMAEPSRRQPGRGRSPFILKLLGLTTAGALIAGVIVLGYSTFRQSNDASSGVLTHSSDDPLAVAAYRYDSPRPLIGRDHWHASYAIFIGDQRQPNIPAFEAGVHTHGDGIIHIHPFQSSEEGAGASLQNFFKYGGGDLTDAILRIPGTTVTYRQDDPVPGDGRPGQIYLFESAGACDSLDLVRQWVRVPPSFVPQDGECIRVAFEPEALMRGHIITQPKLPAPSAEPNQARMVVTQTFSGNACCSSCLAFRGLPTLNGVAATTTTMPRA